MDERAETLVATAAVRCRWDELGPWRLPTRGSVTLGRIQGAGLVVPEPWVSSLLATFTFQSPSGATPGHWIMRNGRRSVAQVENRWVASSVCQPNSLTLLQKGTWQIAWALDHPCIATVNIEVDRGQHDRTPIAVDVDVDAFAGVALGTDLGGMRLDLSPTARHRLAVLYEYLILGEPAPANIIATAAKALDVPRQRILNTVAHTRAQLTDLDVEVVREGSVIPDLGEYLVNTAGVISEDDLDR